MNVFEYINMVEEVKKDWGDVKTYDELLNVNLDFINGRLNESPYHCGPLLDPSPELICNLSKLHNYGLLTVSGQESEKDHGICMKEQEFFYDKILKQGHAYANEQRGYLIFHVEKNSFVNAMNCNVFDSFIQKIKEFGLMYRIINMETQSIDTNINGSYNVTRFRVGKNEKKERSAKWIHNTSIGRGVSRDYYWISPKRGDTTFAPNRILKNTVVFQLAMLEYGVGNLEQIIIDICMGLDLKKHNL